MAHRRSKRVLLVACIAGSASCAHGQVSAIAENPAIDMPAYLAASHDAAILRETHRLTEDDFIRLSRAPGVIILDARSREKFSELHVAGAINIPFSDIAVGTLRDAIPDKSTVVLIYCNNNFVNAPSAFPSKLPAASLNLATYVALYTYGYRNVYELGPIIDIAEARLDFDPPADAGPRARDAARAGSIRAP
jgi:phage shock protein E